MTGTGEKILGWPHVTAQVRASGPYGLKCTVLHPDQKNGVWESLGIHQNGIGRCENFLQFAEIQSNTPFAQAGLVGEHSRTPG